MTNKEDLKGMANKEDLRVMKNEDLNVMRHGLPHNLDIKLKEKENKRDLS